MTDAEQSDHGPSTLANRVTELERSASEGSPKRSLHLFSATSAVTSLFIAIAAFAFTANDKIRVEPAQRLSEDYQRFKSDVSEIADTNFRYLSDLSANPKDPEAVAALQLATHVKNSVAVNDAYETLKAIQREVGPKARPAIAAIDYNVLVAEEYKLGHISVVEELAGDMVEASSEPFETAESLRLQATTLAKLGVQKDIVVAQQALKKAEAIVQSRPEAPFRPMEVNLLVTKAALNADYGHCDVATGQLNDAVAKSKKYHMDSVARRLALGLFKDSAVVNSTCTEGLQDYLELKLLGEAALNRTMEARLGLKPGDLDKPFENPFKTPAKDGPGQDTE